MLHAFTRFRVHVPVSESELKPYILRQCCDDSPLQKFANSSLFFPYRYIMYVHVGQHGTVHVLVRTCTVHIVHVLWTLLNLKQLTVSSPIKCAKDVFQEFLISSNPYNIRQWLSSFISLSPCLKSRHQPLRNSVYFIQLLLKAQNLLLKD